MNNMLGGILPEIVRPAPKKKGGQKQRIGQKTILLKYDERHDNKRDWKWWVKKTRFHIKSWMEMLFE
jgi:hypothetical protein